MKMVTNKIFAVLIVIAFIFGCKSTVTFYVSDSTTTTIPAQIPLNIPYNIPIPPVNSSNTKEFENNNTTPDLIKEVSLNKLSITITGPANQNFSFLKNIAIYIMKADGSQKKKIAYANDINSTAKSIELTPTGENLVPYLKEKSYKLETEYTVKAIPVQDIELRIDLKFLVRAKVI